MWFLTGFIALIDQIPLAFVYIWKRDLADKERTWRIANSQDRKADTDEIGFKYRLNATQFRI